MKILIESFSSTKESLEQENLKILFFKYTSSSRQSLVAQLVKNPPAVQEAPVRFLGREDPADKGQATHSSILGLSLWSAGKESARNVGDLGSIPELGRSPGEGKGYPLQYSGLENSMDCIVHAVVKSWTQLSNPHFTVGRAKCLQLT